MTYCTQTDLETRYGTRELIQATDKAVPPTGAISAPVVERALADADALLDSYLGVRFAVPLSAPVPARVTDAACVIARYKLHEDRPTQKIRDDYQDALRWLEQVAQGRVTIPGLTEKSADPDQDGANFGAASVRAPAAIFTASMLERMP